MLGFIFFAQAVPGIFWWFRFKKYCEKLAELEGRSQEFHSVFGRDEGGLNKFEREQYWKLWAGDHDYRKFNDSDLTAMGDRISARLPLGLLVAVGFVIFCVWSQRSFC